MERGQLPKVLFQMSTRRHASTKQQGASRAVVDEALEVLQGDELRAVVRDILCWLDEQNQARVANMIVERAARTDARWAPAGPSRDVVVEIEAIAAAAVQVGYADPLDVDDYLRQASHAFLSADYTSAARVYRALLIPICDAEIDLGQRELVDEVLGVDVAACAAQYVVATYMTTPLPQRAEAVRSAIAEVQYIGNFWEPLRAMERVAVGPLPELQDFHPLWRALCEQGVSQSRRDDWDPDSDRWLREVVRRLEGADGLARIARSTRRADDLRAWCRTLVASADWKAALSAYKEAARLVVDKDYSRGAFLDGAALAAQELARKDLASHLERAWRETPSLIRLQRWLGSCGRRYVMIRRAKKALAECPKTAHRQRALLHVLLGDLKPAARLLAAGPGLGWSDSEHPGHLLFPVFYRLLGAEPSILTNDIEQLARARLHLHDLAALTDAQDGPRLATPHIDDLLELVGTCAVSDGEDRKVLIKSMRTAAEKRVAGVTGKKRRRYYGHAASLVAACFVAEPTPESTTWVTSVRDEYRRFPALRGELAQRGC